ncbi:hypothetical protein BKA62DRAFT_684056 [Auriculariales sp. MPI-PUGE-AT-0066]|nr:hypothetical protein BKA62DRAFT_684056 [Auriculariales sp. MPI-PUGE-AT-0066]
MAPRGRRANKPSTPAAVDSIPATSSAAPESVPVDDATTCFICAEPVKYYAVSQCNHRTCHVCALRLRALYKKRECTFCKTDQPRIIQTLSPDALFESFAPLPFTDNKLDIAFESQEMMEDTLLLLRFNCPDPDCTFYGTGWSDLKQHVRAVHKKSMCHICIGAKKIFAHEHTLYTNAELAIHIPSLRRREKLPAGINPADIEGGVHPICEFCMEPFNSDEELYPHMRDRHEKCFVCERNGDRFVYFRNYEELEAHFGDSHFLCTHPICREQKFVVFDTQMDLTAHTVEAHGGDLSAKDKREARRLIDVTFQPSAPAPAASGRRRHFGAGLSVPPGSSGSAEPPPVTQVTPRLEEPPEDLDPAVASAQTAFLARFTPGASLAIRAALRSFRAGESGARDLISTLFNVLERELETTGSYITPLLECLPPDSEKRSDLLSAWRDYQIEQRKAFPDLVPRQAQAGAEYAGATAGRVLNVKHSSASRSGAQTRKVWDRVAQAAAGSSGASSSSSAPGPSSRPLPPGAAPSASTAGGFPTLSGGSGPAAGRSGTHTTPWVSAASSAPAFRPAVAPSPVVPRSVPGQGARKPTGPTPKLNSSAFPSLPTSAPTNPVQSLRAQGFISGNTSARASPAVSGTSTPNPINVSAFAEDDNTDGGPAGNGGGKKKKGKQKQTLFTLGAFPTTAERA